MATSGSYNFEVSRDDLIKDAIRLVNAQLRGTDPDSVQISDAARALNMMVKAWQADGMPLWAIREVFVLPQASTAGYTAQTYQISGTSWHVTTTPIYTKTSATSAAAASTVTVTTVAGITSGLNIGVELSTGVMHWTTVNGAPAGNVVTLTAALPASVASGASVYVYNTTTRAPRFLRVLGAWNVNFDTGSRFPMQYTEFDSISTLNSTGRGTPVQVSYIPEKYTGISTQAGSLYIYPGWSNGDTTIQLRVQYPYQDFDVNTDEPDFPQEWFEAIKYGLAVRLAPEYGLPKEDRLILKEEARQAKKLALEAGPEQGSVFFQPEVR